MRLTLTCLLIGLLIPLGVTAYAQEPETPPPAPPAVDTPDREPPPHAQPPPPERDRPRHLGDAPRPRPGPGPRFPGSRQAQRPMSPVEPLLRAIAERRPELAERLERLRRESPQRFREVLLDALMFRLEESLDSAERQPPRHRGPGQPRHEGRMEPRPRPPFAGDSERLERLERGHEALEMRSHELVEHLRELRHADGPPQARRGVREELERVVHEQFEVRSELRRMELERGERELHELRGMLERMERGLKERERQRDTIIERRLRQLLHEGDLDW